MWALSLGTHFAGQTVVSPPETSLGVSGRSRASPRVELWSTFQEKQLWRETGLKREREDPTTRGRSLS